MPCLSWKHRRHRNTWSRSDCNNYRRITLGIQSPNNCLFQVLGGGVVKRGIRFDTLVPMGTRLIETVQHERVCQDWRGCTRGGVALMEDRLPPPVLQYSRSLVHTMCGHLPFKRYFPLNSPLSSIMEIFSMECGHSKKKSSEVGVLFYPADCYKLGRWWGHKPWG